MSEFDAQLITPVWGTRAIVDCCILKVGLRTVPPEVAECCPEPCQDSGQPLFHISSHHVSSLHLRPFRHFWIWRHLPKAMLRSSTKPLRSICEQNTCQYISPHRRGIAASDKGKRV